ncbi:MULTISPECIES: hypothetical protein [Aphanothece]|uniref:hypothetical protein n=1 Tax=Aphanothece TaxID=1121 RepID=UPI0039853982
MPEHLVTRVGSDDPLASAQSRRVDRALADADLAHLNREDFEAIDVPIAEVRQ